MIGKFEDNLNDDDEEPSSLYCEGEPKDDEESQGDGDSPESSASGENGESGESDGEEKEEDTCGKEGKGPDYEKIVQVRHLTETVSIVRVLWS